MYELGGAKQAGSTYAHGGPAGKRGKSLREGRKNAAPPLLNRLRPKCGGQWGVGPAHAPRRWGARPPLGSTRREGGC